ncbi:RNA polymerase sigma factor [Flavihumibacter petaseus]|uniref:RNA polymerase sigma factor n=1 Tax=Flavihumibacter petaseus NBRC 106054 TaxID=1220578 RepID=A0A0E9MXV6_9BACT|nr:RNA polymerase sigma factor [Flavihumibacter petaseus]GAO42552.1 putative RNA polymerase ECF-type sigma factor [Flavihumibacter petaseus NBRC 106054]
MDQQFTALYQQHSPGIYKVCLGYTGDISLAQDLLQETFLSAWRHRHQYRGEAQWSTWIYRIAVNTCLGHLRKKKDRVTDPEVLAALPMMAESNEKEQQVQLLYRCISQLPEADRLIITLVLDDKPYAEIAGITGITENNLRVRIHRIKKQLTEIYNRYEQL